MTRNLTEPDGYVKYNVAFDFTDEQAETLGHALVRWAQRSRAEKELIRCGIPGCRGRS